MDNQNFTPEQLEQIKKQGEMLGPEAIKAVEAEWPVLIAEVKSYMDRGVDPKDPEVQPLAKRWMELVNMFTGGDPGIAEALKKQWQDNGDRIREQYPEGSPTPEMFGYIQRALG